MKNKKIFDIILLVVMMLFVTGCSMFSTKEKEISLGSWDGNTYTNEFLGLTYDMPEDWTRYSDEQIKEVMDIGLELTDASEISKKLAEITSVTYMMTSSSTGTNFILMSEKQINDVSVKDYAEALKTGLASQTIVNYQLSDTKNETVNGHDFVTVEAEVSGMRQKYYMYKLDKYMVSIILTITDGSDADTLMNQFDFN